MSESRLVSAVVATLNLQRSVLAWRCNTGVARAHGSHVRYGLGNGTPDVLAVLAPWGHLIGLEGKLPGRDLDPEQHAWASALRAHGGSFGVFRSVPEALAFVAEVRSTLQAGGSAQPSIAQAVAQASAGAIARSASAPRRDAFRTRDGQGLQLGPKDALAGIVAQRRRPSEAETRPGSERWEGFS